MTSKSTAKKLYSIVILNPNKAKKRIESAKLSYEFGAYGRALGYTKQAFGYSTLSFVLGIGLTYGLAITLGLYFFL